MKAFKETMYIKISEGKKRYIEGQRDNYFNAFIDEQSKRLKKDKNDNTFPGKYSNICKNNVQAKASTLFNAII